ncbi:MULTISPECIES: monofunctional biosynthetic peptidoglycan transglycosylase [Pseudooceanicola]|uniref:monofunctional biosynthetic peptidoglycan transglycosylase n=1 Tax=Pseudooceanicola TaxID=1679449 RepID=UPI0035CC44C3
MAKQAERKSPRAKTGTKKTSKAPAKAAKAAAAAPARRRLLRLPRLRIPTRRGLRRRLGLTLVGVVGLALALVAVNSVVRPFQGIYMHSEARRLGGIEQSWVPMDQIAPVMARSAVAAEDANFCRHWGFDMSAIRDAIADGMSRGGSTITQQVAKNVYLWQGRSYVRKALEAGFTPAIELFWTKRRILEVYLNVAEFDEGVFGVEAGAMHYFGVHAAQLNATQAARLAAILPSPQAWSASHPTNYVLRRSRQIIDGAATIRRDGRAACFED